MDIAFIKQRAMEYVEQGNLPLAHASLTADLMKNENTGYLVSEAIALTTKLASGEMNKTSYTEWLNNLLK